MPEKKVKPAAKKAVAAKISNKVADKPKSTKLTPTSTNKKTTAKKPAVAKPRKPKAATVKKAVTPAVKKKAASTKKAVVKKSQAFRQVSSVKTMAPNKAAKITPEERYRMVETAAYFIAERHGFQGRSDEHWAAAELEVAARLGR
jgi:hypothetical protein